MIRMNVDKQQLETGEGLEKVVQKIILWVLINITKIIILFFLNNSK